ncbi:nucleotidyltransferase family protein [Polynucleobacter sp. 39-46-10]|nr:nucleotidyltransferase family protein [Polynucleobacter sp. 39-46-10]
MTSFDPSAQATQLRLAVLLLAAGEGSRLGTHPKALLHRDGQTLLQRFSDAIQGFNPVEYIVVTGFHAQAIESEIAKLNPLLAHQIQGVRNPSPERGQPSSVRLGLESLQVQFDVLLVALSDQPEIGEAEIQDLLDEYIKREAGEEIILPVFNGKRGNPALFSYEAISEVLKTPDMVCRVYMDARPKQVRVMSTSKQAFVMDVDTLEDIQLHKLSMT